MHARTPDRTGYSVRSGVRVYWEIFGDHDADRVGPTVLLLPTWSALPARVWKMQIPYLARHFRVVTFDPRGNGRSDPAPDSEGYADTVLAEDAVAVLDATDTASAVCVGLSMGTGVLLRLAVEHPNRVAGAVFVSPAVGLSESTASEWAPLFDDVRETDEGWAKCNAAYWRRDLAGFARFFFGEMFPEPHSSKAIDDCVGWMLDAGADTLIQTMHAPYLSGGDDAATPMAVQLARRVQCPTLVVYPSDERLAGRSDGADLAAALGARCEVFEGAGHGLPGRHPVRFNLVLREFAASITPAAPKQSTWLFARERKRRVLWISSPIGLGHILRDLAIARTFRQRVPDVEIHWWAQPPVTTVLEAEGEIVHPASAEMASESAHWESESTHHDLHAFYAFRRMDEIFCANYMLFDDVVRETPYDMWVGDESWEVDHFLHENPERKIAPYAFMTDVIGFLPVDAQSDPREAELCADYNAEMIEHLARYPYVRDRSVFIGGLDELPDASFGPGLPRIRDWSAKWFTPVPYVVPFEPAQYRRTAALRMKLGYGTGYPLYVCAVGGTAVGRDLLELIAEGFALVRKDQPDARMVMVTGPRIRTEDLPDVEGMDKLGYVPSLFEHLACADVAIVQGGLSTTMELVAARRPFVYFPLAHHWEQQHFVTHRLDHYRAGIRMAYARTTPADLAAAIERARVQRPAYRAVPRGGAVKAAAQLASLLVR